MDGMQMDRSVRCDASVLAKAQQVRVEFQLLADTLADLFLSDRQCAHELIVQVYA